MTDIEKLRNAANYLADNFSDEELNENASDLLDSISRLASILADKAFLADYPDETNIALDLKEKLANYEINNHDATFRSFDII